MWSTLIALALLAPPVVVGPNLIPNADFAGPPTGWRMPAQVTLDDTVGHGDSRSLKLVNPDAADYPLAHYDVPCVPGRSYRFAVWVRTEGVAGAGTGATITLQSEGAGGYLGGDYPAGRRGTQDWTRIEGMYTIPEAAVNTSLSLYLRRGGTGTAWFDDVELYEVAEPPLRVNLVQPNYRNWLRGEEVSVLYWLADTLPDGLTAEQTLLELTLRDETAVIRRQANPPQPPGPVPGSAGTLPVPRLMPGAYTFEVRLLRADTEAELAAWSTELTVRDPALPAPKVSIDAQGFTLVEGQRFLPLGLYLGSVNPDELAQIAAAGYNTIMPYNSARGDDARNRQWLDWAHEAGLRTIYSVKDHYYQLHSAPPGLTSEEVADAAALAQVAAVRDHPAVLAWYLNDELPLTVHDQLLRRNELIKAADPDHPTWSVLYQVPVIDRYADTADVLGTDPYPIPRALPAMAGQWTAQTLAAKGGAGAIWQVPQVFDWAAYTEQGVRDPRPPTLQEMRTMAYQCLAAGAKGLIFYSWFDLLKFPDTFDARYADITQLAADIHAIEPWILADAPTGLSLAPPAEADASLYRARAWGPPPGGGGSLLLATNGSDEPVTLTLGGPEVTVGATLAGDGELVGRQLTLPPRGSLAVVVNE